MTLLVSGGNRRDSWLGEEGEREGGKGRRHKGGGGGGETEGDKILKSLSKIFTSSSQGKQAYVDMYRGSRVIVVLT